MRILREGLALPVTHNFTKAITVMLNEKGISGDSVTINFRDPTYSAENGGFHPVEIRLERQNNAWHLCYITDFAYLGSGPYVELAKDLDFDFQAGVFQNLFGVFPIEQAVEMYQIWEGNFLHYWQMLSPYEIVITGD